MVQVRGSDVEKRVVASISPPKGETNAYRSDVLVDGSLVEDDEGRIVADTDVSSIDQVSALLVMMMPHSYNL